MTADCFKNASNSGNIVKLSAQLCNGSILKVATSVSIEVCLQQNHSGNLIATACIVLLSNAMNDKRNTVDMSRKYILISHLSCITYNCIWECNIPRQRVPLWWGL